MDNSINIDQYTHYTVDFYIGGHWQFSFLSDSTKKKIRSVCIKFQETEYQKALIDGQMKEKFYEFLTKNGIFYLLMKEESISV